MEKCRRTISNESLLPTNAPIISVTEPIHISSVKPQWAIDSGHVNTVVIPALRARTNLCNTDMCRFFFLTQADLETVLFYLQWKYSIRFAANGWNWDGNFDVRSTQEWLHTPVEHDSIRN